MNKEKEKSEIVELSGEDNENYILVEAQVMMKAMGKLKMTNQAEFVERYAKIISDIIKESDEFRQGVHNKDLTVAEKIVQALLARIEKTAV